MITVARTACPPALEKTDPNAAGPRELVRLTEKLEAGEQLKSGDFSAYARLDVRDALRAMFHGKCAYCESKIAGSQDTDIEHYRPKKGVTEAKDAGIVHDGYWWLAMDWENLVLSCMHCNQSRSKQQTIPDSLEAVDDIERFLTDAPRATTGKANSFPTQDSVWVTEPHKNHHTEKPLIINPVDVDPTHHLEWVLIEGASIVRSKNGSEAGEATRQILGLNRRWLEEDRRLLLLHMLKDRLEIIQGIVGWNNAETDAESEPWGLMADNGIERLKQRTKANQPFAGLARAFLEKVRKDVAKITAAADN